MRKRARLRTVGLMMSVAVLCGCNYSESVKSNSSDAPPAAKAETPIVLLSVTSDVNENPQSIDMAMKLAGFSLDEGRKVALFFNVKGVNIPTKHTADDLKFQENEPLKTQLQGLIKRGAEVHVCPVCMKALGVEAEDIMEGAQVTTRPKLFANIGANTSVFTY